MEASFVKKINTVDMNFNDDETINTCDTSVEECDSNSHSSTQESDTDTDTEVEAEAQLESQLICSENAVESKRLLFKRKYSEDKECPVCMVSMKGNVVGHSPCGHTVCRDCLLNQINKSTYISYMYKCPICRYDLKLFLEPILQYNFRENIKKMMLSYP